MKTKIRSIIVCLLFALILSAVCAPVSAETFTIGGTVPSVSIRNESDYLVFRNEVAEGKSFEGELVVLETNLDLSSGCEPIGDDTHRFEGTFDGRGYSVTYSIDGDGENVGLVYVALATETDCFVRKLKLGATTPRSRIRLLAANNALDMVRRYLTGKEI